jgi:hypothetical protein
MTVEIKEFHTSPWVLPNEMVMGWLKWTGDDHLEKIVINTDANVQFERIHGYSGSHKSVNGQMEIDPQGLEIPGYFGFVAYYRALPDTELDIAFNAALRVSAELTVKATSTTQIVRPLLHIAGLDSIKIDNSMSNPSISIKLVNSAEAEALDLDVTAEVISEPPGAIEIVIEKATSIFERAPIRLISMSNYLSRIKVKKPGKAKATIVFSYKDRADNSYKASLKEVEFVISAENIVIPIKNIVQGDADEVELQAAVPVISQ